MNTYGVGLIDRPWRRRHSAEFKAVLAVECLRTGVSIAAATLAHGLNANMLRKLVIDGEHRLASPLEVVAPQPEAPSRPAPTFVRGHPRRLTSARSPSRSIEPARQSRSSGRHQLTATVQPRSRTGRADPRGGGVAVPRAHGHACRHQHDAGPRGLALTRDALSLRLCLLEQALHAAGGTRARRHWHLAGRTQTASGPLGWPSAALACRHRWPVNSSMPRCWARFGNAWAKLARPRCCSASIAECADVHRWWLQDSGCR
jgi:transposase-like protein